MFRHLSLVLCILFGVTVLDAANKEQEHLAIAGIVLEEILNVPDNIRVQNIEWRG